MIRYHVNQLKELTCKSAILQLKDTIIYLLNNLVLHTQLQILIVVPTQIVLRISITHKQCSENDFLFNNFSTLFTKFLPNSQNTINLSEFADFGQN